MTLLVKYFYLENKIKSSLCQRKSLFMNVNTDDCVRQLHFQQKHYQDSFCYKHRSSDRTNKLFQPEL